MSLPLLQHTFWSLLPFMALSSAGLCATLPWGPSGTAHWGFLLSSCRPAGTLAPLHPPVAPVPGASICYGVRDAFSRPEQRKKYSNSNVIMHEISQYHVQVRPQPRKQCHSWGTSPWSWAQHNGETTPPVPQSSWWGHGEPTLGCWCPAPLSVC